MQLTLILIFLYVLGSDGSINYCGAKMCAHTNAHTFCRYPPGPSPSCIGYIDSELSSEEQARILDRLNRRRSQVARGLRGLPAAGDMLKLRWVDELAREAQRWADQCRLPSTPDSPEEHDSCRDLYSISVGQCVASVVGEAPGLRPETMVDMWYMQSMNYDGNATSYTPPLVFYEKSSLFLAHTKATTMTLLKWFGHGRIWWDAEEAGLWYELCVNNNRFRSRESLPIPWRDRQRTVERLVCNFAPRGPIPGRPLWSLAEPAAACPPRSRPDDDLPALCTFQYEMDESYDEDNVMTVGEHLLLNTIMLIEKNKPSDNIGTMDEVYLTKLAVATIDNSVLTQTPYSSVQKRDLVNKAEIISKNVQDELKIDAQSNSTEGVKNISIHVISKKILKPKGTFVGRPKAYDIEELNGHNVGEASDKTEITITETEKRDNYDDYKVSEIQDDTTLVTIPLTLPVISTYETSFNAMAENNTEASIPMEISTNSTSKALDIYIDDIVSNLSLSNILNDTTIDDNVIEEYLSNPETVRQIQESLKRMEHKLAVTATVSGKVRRELREPYQQNQSKNRGTLSAEAERNKSIERGPMLNMVLKYVPYLKQYEKNIMGDASSRGISFGYVFVHSFCNIAILLRFIF